LKQVIAAYVYKQSTIKLICKSFFFYLNRDYRLQAIEVACNGGVVFRASDL